MEKEQNNGMANLFDFANKFIEAYHIALLPLCKELGLPPMALDILLFMANNTDHATAKDVCIVRGFKTGIVSVHIERLVQEGLIERVTVVGDRRKIKLITTEKAIPIIEKGRAKQLQFGSTLINGVNEEDFAVWKRVLETIDSNVEGIRKNGRGTKD